MTESRTWLESIEADFPDQPWTRQALIDEAQRTRFVGSLPDGFEFLAGAILDLGFEKLGLPAEELARVRRAFVSGGLAVPGTGHRLRNLRPAQSLVEPADGNEQATLPAHWKQGVVVIGNDDRFAWIGKRAGREQFPEVDRPDYEDAGDGWRLKVAPSTRPSSRPG